jgi:hypothetical protein
MNFPQPEMTAVEKYDLIPFQEGFVSLIYPPALPGMISLHHMPDEFHLDIKAFKNNHEHYFIADNTKDFNIKTKSDQQKNATSTFPSRRMFSAKINSIMFAYCTKVLWCNTNQLVMYNTLMR